VDSDGASRETLERGLRQAGYEVLTVTDASAAREAFAGARPDVVLSEVDALPELLELDSEAPVMVFFAHEPLASARLLDALEAVLSSRGLPADLLEVTTTTETSPPRVPGASMEELERFAILSTLAAHGGSTSQAARTLGISVRKIQYRLRQYAAARGSDAPLRLPSAGVGIELELCASSGPPASPTRDAHAQHQRRKTS
jgi:DNA-binding NtrC family response regulator